MNIDYDDLQCPNCGKFGMVSDGDLDWYCPKCHYEGSESNEPDEDEERYEEEGSVNYFEDEE